MERITDLRQLDKYRGYIVLVRTEFPADWQAEPREDFRLIGDLYVGHTRYGYYAATRAITKEGGHGMLGIEGRDLERFTISVRFATQAEIDAITLSYGVAKPAAPDGV